MKLEIELEAYRWYQNGDHPDDEYEKGTGNEGKIVRRYRNPKCDGQTICPAFCGYIMHDHGWLYSVENGQIICPGDWVIKGANGIYFSVHPSIFEEMTRNSGDIIKRRNVLDGR